MKTQKLEVGEKYLTIYLFDGQVKLTAFPNKFPKGDKSPHFVGNGIMVYVNEKKPEKTDKVEVQKVPSI